MREHRLRSLSFSWRPTFAALITPFIAQPCQPAHQGKNAAIIMAAFFLLNERLS